MCQRGLDWRSRCRPGQSWLKLERHNNYCVARANGLPQEVINSGPLHVPAGGSLVAVGGAAPVTGAIAPVALGEVTLPARIGYCVLVGMPSF